MRILFVTSLKYTDICGVITHMKNLMNGLKQLYHDVDYVTLSSIPKSIQIFVISFPTTLIKRISPDFRWMFKIILIDILFSFFILFKQLKNGYDIINVQDEMVYHSLFLVRKIFKVPVIVTAHSYVYDTLGGRNIKNSLVEQFFVNSFRHTYDRVDRIVAVDSRIKEHIVTNYNILPQKIIISKNFVDVDEFKPRTGKKMFRDMFGLPKNKFIVLCPRRLTKKNGVIYPAIACRYIKNKLNDDFILVYTGKGGTEGITIENIAHKDGVSQNIIFLGNVTHDKMKYLFNASDVVIIPSVNFKGLEEATSLSALEAMSSGIPTIASNIGGLKEIIKNNETGYLIEEKSPKEIAKKIYEVYTEDQNRIIENARHFVVKECSHIKRAKEFLKWYVEIIRNR